MFLFVRLIDRLIDTVPTFHRRHPDTSVSMSWNATGSQLQHFGRYMERRVYSKCCNNRL